MAAAWIFLVLGTMTSVSAVSVLEAEIESTTYTISAGEEHLSSVSSQEQPSASARTCSLVSASSQPVLSSELLHDSCPLGEPVVKLHISTQAHTVHQDAFRSFERLTTLWLDNNLLTEVPVDAFADHLPRLKSLSMRNNRLQTIRGDEFRRVVHLEWLSLSENEITFVHPASFSSLEGLTFLNLSWNQITALDGKLLHPLRRLKVLDLSYNNLATLNSGLLVTLGELGELRLRGNLLDTLHQNAFVALKELKYLDLAYNFFRALPTRLMGSNRKLEELHLEGNLLERIEPSNGLTELTYLKHLDLSNNRIESAGNETLLPRTQAQLLYLDLQGNRLQLLHPLVLQTTELLLQNNRLQAVRRIKGPSGHQAVQSLMLYGNAIETVEQDAFQDLSLLETLYLDNNRITELPPLLFKSNDHLQHVTCSYNRLTTLKTNTFAGLSRLHSVDLAHNALTTIELAAFHGSPIRYLNLNGNRLTRLDGRALSGTKLHYLHADSNAIVSLQDLGPSVLDELQELSLKDNRIDSFSEFCSEHRYPMLTVLELSSNALLSVDQNCLTSPLARANQAVPVSIGLTYNNLSETPVFSGPVHALDLTGNSRLELQSNHFQAYQSTEKLLLRDTLIRILSANHFTFLPDLKHLEVGSQVLERVEDDALDLLQLEHLTISGSLMVAISSELLKGQNQLQTVSYAHNRLTTLSADTFCDSQQLVEIDLSFNQLTTIDPLLFKDLINLRTINLESNRLTTIPGHPALKGLFLEALSVANNSITTIDHGSMLIQIPIQSLNISQNNLTDLELLDRNTHINRLDVSWNQLCRLKLQPHYRTLIAYSNQIQSVRWATTDLQFHLQYLALADNLLAEIDQRLFTLRFLQTLDLSENRLSSFPFEQLHQLKLLQVLDVSRNNIRRLPAQGVPYFRVYSLDLSENPLDSLPVQLLNSSAVQSLTIDHRLMWSAEFP
ncbi:protein artichoke-like [Anopheles albimanus]|uniref:protein artichoke-like n=1 Tax=Anopheles albimanus TaxID=7167 RepID=UPI00163E26D4|nr:protein artichoke-like [Anopheles albimanus]